jgi:hypothetical protein
MKAVLTSALDGCQCSASHSGRFTPLEKSPLCPLDRRLDGSLSRSGRGTSHRIDRKLLVQVENPCSSNAPLYSVTNKKDEYPWEDRKQATVPKALKAADENMLNA